MNRIITGEPGFIIMNQKPNGRACNGSTRHLLLPKISSLSPLLESLCRRGSGTPKGLLEHYTEKGVTVTSVNYSNMLRNDLRPAIRSKRRGRLTQYVLLLHDNARPHTAHLTINTIRQLNWEVLEYSAYSPDLAPSDFHLFGPLKNALRGHQFAADDEVKEAVHDWLHSQPQTFFSSGIKKLTDRWAKCIEKKGDYIEK